MLAFRVSIDGVTDWPEIIKRNSGKLTIISILRTVDGRVSDIQAKSSVPYLSKRSKFVTVCRRNAICGTHRPSVCVCFRFPNRINPLRKRFERKHTCIWPTGGPCAAGKRYARTRNSFGTFVEHWPNRHKFYFCFRRVRIHLRSPKWEMEFDAVAAKMRKACKRRDADWSIGQCLRRQKVANILS